ncbi:hypothetical protein VTK73DRAFT_8580 [Phialemonium thermophilum]|uniref:Uncharacterized protein n=1 Tax=Phialemonium thermophilum TaxID=223376 RepID=A0ABR3W7Z3_9PEZI
MRTESHWVDNNIENKLTPTLEYLAAHPQWIARSLRRFGRDEPPCPHSPPPLTEERQLEHNHLYYYERDPAPDRTSTCLAVLHFCKHGNKRELLFVLGGKTRIKSVANLPDPVKLTQIETEQVDRVGFIRSPSGLS